MFFMHVVFTYRGTADVDYPRANSGEMRYIYVLIAHGPFQIKVKVVISMRDG